MYIPAAFDEQRKEVLHAFIREHGFATIISAGPAGMEASHVPVVLRPEIGDRGILEFHLARQNAHSKLLAEGAAVLAIFHGPHVYISPQWYKTPVAVPTWNYVVVHARGVARKMSDAELKEHLIRLSAVYEPAAGWSMERLSNEVSQKLQAMIEGFEVKIERLEGKWKLGQNRSREDVMGAIEALRSQQEPDALKIAALMQATIAASGDAR